MYETEKLLSEYISFHYCPPEEYMAYDFGPKSALDFPKRCADLCLEYKPVSGSGRGGGALLWVVAYLRGI